MIKKNIKFLIGTIFAVGFFLFVNNVAMALDYEEIEYTKECPKGKMLNTDCTLNGQTGTCKLRRINGTATKICVVENEETSKPKDEEDASSKNETKPSDSSENNNQSEKESQSQTKETSQAFDYTQEPTFKGLVPCGTDENDVPCTLCHLIIGIQRIFRYGLYLVTTLAFVGLFIGGAMYMLSSGDETMLNSAKSFLKNVLIGFSLTIGAWLIVNVVLNILPLSEGMGVNKARWYEFSCSTDSSMGTGGSPTKPPGSGEEDPLDDGSKEKKCGLDNKGKCFPGSIAVVNCPGGYTPATGNPLNPCESGYSCCEPNGLPTDPTGRCGINNAGECKPGVISCPSGWTATMGNPDNPCPSGSKCCVKNGESSETCRGSFSTVEGKCFYGMSSCPKGWSHPWFGTCSASQSICCVKK